MVKQSISRLYNINSKTFYQKKEFLEEIKDFSKS